MSRVVPNVRKNRRVGIAAFACFLSMVGLAYASVPLYKVFCAKTGFGGTTQRAEKAPDQASAQYIQVRFDANTSTELGWKFQPKQTVMRVRIGEQNMAYYEATNVSGVEKTGSATYNVSPPSMGAYFDKIQCFCFTKQTLKPGESAEFPVTFFVDPAMLKDADAAGTGEVTLSYTFYPAGVPDLAQKQASTN